MLKTKKQKAKFLLALPISLAAYGIYGIGYLLESIALHVDNILIDFVEGNGI